MRQLFREGATRNVLVEVLVGKNLEKSVSLRMFPKSISRQFSVS